MLKRIGQSGVVQALLGYLLGSYLKLVRWTTRISYDPPDLVERVAAEKPVILAMWHGQHFMVPFLPEPRPVVALISRHRDGEINAIAATMFGVGSVRGSGGRPEQMWRKGGVSALRDMLKVLKGGTNIGLTADIPKVARVAGEGILRLAQMSGRPIVPMTVVTSRRFDFRSWDRASMGKPFGRAVAAMGEPIRVARDADDATIEAARRRLEVALDDLHARAYAAIGAADPGRDVAATARAARIEAPAG